MDIKDITGGLWDVISSVFAEAKYVKEVLLAVGAVALLGGGFWGYRLYVASREQKAQKVFSAAMEEYDRNVQTKNPQWDDIALLFKLGYEQNSGSQMAPYFLMKQVDAMLEDGKKEEVLPIIDQAIDLMSSSSPLINLYKTKRSLILLEQGDKQLQAAGFAALQELAQDKDNLHRDYAGFHLGQYYLSRGEYDNARETWQAVVAQQDYDRPPLSPWAEKARLLLPSIL